LANKFTAHSSYGAESIYGEVFRTSFGALNMCAGTGFNILQRISSHEILPFLFVWFIGASFHVPWNCQVLPAGVGTPW
jgi:hypothetical protein